MTTRVDQLVPVREWAEAHGFTQDYVRALCRQGRLKAVRLGHNWYIIKDSVESNDN
jgi:chromosome partitioning protein